MSAERPAATEYGPTPEELEERIFSILRRYPVEPDDAPLVFHDSPHDDWLVLPSWNRLHRIFRIAWEGGSLEIECHGQGIAVCGAAGDFCIPGFMSRMGLERCAHCCAALGIPRGNGNTLNAGIEEPLHV